MECSPQPVPVSPVPRTVAEPWPQRWLARHRSAVDLVVLSLVLAYNQIVMPTVVTTASGLWMAEGLCAGLGLCWLLRRRSARVAFTVMICFAWIQPVVDPGAGVLPIDILLVLEVHHLASTQRWTWSLPAAALVVVWVLVAFIPVVTTGYSRLSLPALCAVTVAWAWTAGTLQRMRRAHLIALTRNTEYRLREAELRREQVEREERSRIAREIHDIVSHSLGIMTVVADGAAATAPSDPGRAAEAMLRVRDTGREALAQMRRMLTALRGEDRPRLAPQPGLQDLKDLVAEAGETGIPVRLEVSDSLDLPEELGPTVYRLVQEGLSNVRRHAGAVTRVEARVHRADTTPESLVIEVLDDGASSPAPSSGDPAGYGLVGIRERVASHGGSLEAGARPDGGFRLRAVLPLGVQEDA